MSVNEKRGVRIGLGIKSGFGIGGDGGFSWAAMLLKKMMDDGFSILYPLTLLACPLVFNITSAPFSLYNNTPPPLPIKEYLFCSLVLYCTSTYLISMSYWPEIRIQ